MAQEQRWREDRDRYRDPGHEERDWRGSEWRDRDLERERERYRRQVGGAGLGYGREGREREYEGSEYGRPGREEFGREGHGGDWGRSASRYGHEGYGGGWRREDYEPRGYGRGLSEEYTGYGVGRGGGAYTGGGYGAAERWGYGRAGYSSEDYGRGREGYRGREERGFWDRAADEVASWFGDEGAEQRRQQDHRGRGPRGYTRSDDRIREDVNDRLADDPYVDASEIEVSVSGGEVTLSGTVDQRNARRRAEDIAERVSGVKYVQNNLRVRQAGTTTTGATTGAFGSSSVTGASGASPGSTSSGAAGTSRSSSSTGT